MIYNKKSGKENCPKIRCPIPVPGPCLEGMQRRLRGQKKLAKEAFGSEKQFYPQNSEYNIYFGELHGHTCLSDGVPTIDEYFTSIRDIAKLDFAALTDHDHGGIGKPELFGEKWELIKKKVREYNQPHRFTTILGYERDSYPWYNNMIIYYNNYDGELLRGAVDGEITREELLKALSREDLLLVPHDTYSLESGADFLKMDSELFTPLIEIYSRGDSAEYFNNPYNDGGTRCEGGFWQDALARGAKMGCIAASDDHSGENGLTSNHFEGIARFPGITGVLAKANTLDALFEALKARRCYGFTGGRMRIDFRINGHHMGEEFKSNENREIYIKVEADNEIDKITLVKNCRDYIMIRKDEQLLFDYCREKKTDVYYLRIELKDGRLGWTSPIWINE